MRFIKRCTECGARIVIVPPFVNNRGVHSDGHTVTYIVLEYLDAPSGTCCSYERGGYGSRCAPPFNAPARPTS